MNYTANVQKQMITTRVEGGWRAWYQNEEENVVFHRNREEAMRLLKEKDEEIQKKQGRLLPAGEKEL